MRRLILTLWVCLTVACGGPTEPAAGTVRFTVATNCAFGALAWDFYADLHPLGSATLSPGQSASFPVAAGTHTFRAVRQSAAPGEYNGAATVTAGQTAEQTITCG